MLKKQSTNDKLNQILNGPDDEDDASIKAHNAFKETKAKSRLRRTSLYSNGARARVPKLQKSIDDLNSPFALSDTKLLSTQFLKAETSSVPPGAHEEQFRRIQTNTTISLKDPDRVFFQPSLLNPSIRRVDQPPWYLGNQNKIGTHDITSIFRFADSIIIFPHSSARFIPDSSGFSIRL